MLSAKLGKKVTSKPHYQKIPMTMKTTGSSKDNCDEEKKWNMDWNALRPRINNNKTKIDIAI